LQQLDEQSLNGIDTVNAASQQLASNNESLQNGSQQLKEGTDLMAAQQNTLHSMSQGLQQLGDAFTQLNNGALKLYTGQQQFSEQAMKPLQEMADLAEGELSTLTDTMNEIKSLSNQNKNFAGAPEGAICKVNYVFSIKE
jgi:chromosome segregation ATPase